MEELILKAEKGDLNSFNSLMKLLEKDLYRIAGIRLKSNEDICDAIQNTMINVYKNIKKVKDIKFFKTWVIKILINECNTIYKINLKNNNFLKKIIENEKDKIILNEEMDENKFFIEFDKLIDGLNSDEQLIFILFYKYQYSSKEISNIMKINSQTVKSKLYRGRNKIKDYIKYVLKNDKWY